MSLITIEQLLESVELDFEPRFITQNKSGTVELWKTKPTKTDSGYWCNPPSRIIYFSCLKLAEFENKPWSECIYEVPRKKTTGKIEPIYVPRNEDFAGSGVYAIELIKRLNQVIEAVNEINENYARIAALTDIRKRLDTLEKCVKNKRGEE